MKKSIVVDVREIIGHQYKQKKIARKRCHYQCIKCRKPFLKFLYQKLIQGCGLGVPNSGGGNISKKLNFLTKKCLQSDKLSTPKICISMCDLFVTTRH